MANPLIGRDSYETCFVKDLSHFIRILFQLLGQTICSSILEISDGKGRPLPRRLVLTSTHLHIQRNITKDNATDNDADSNRPTHGSVSDRGLSGDGSFDSFGEFREFPPDSPPPEFNVSFPRLNYEAIV